MRVMYVKETGGVVASCVGDIPSVHVPEGPMVFTDMVHSLVLVDWFQTSLEVSGAITAGRKRAAEGDAAGGPAAGRARGGLEAPAAGESSAAVPALAVDARRAPVYDLDGCPHTSKVDTEERVEDLQFLIRMLDPPRFKAFTRHLLFRGGTLLESAYEAVAPGCESGATGSAPGLSALQDLRSLPFLAEGAGEGSPLHSFAHGKWRSDDLSLGCFLEFVTAGAVKPADYLQNVVSSEAREVFSAALRNFERFLCAVFGHEFAHAFQPLREGLESGGEWSRFDNVLVARNVHVMLVRWMSDIHQRVESAFFPPAALNTPLACATLLKMYVKDLLTAARERRVADDWCVGGHLDFYRPGSGRFWFLNHPKFGGVLLLLKERAKKPPTLTPRGGALGGGAGDAAPGTVASPALMPDGQRCVCAQHLCGLLRIKAMGRKGQVALGPCLAAKGMCRFWHPTQLVQMTRSQALNALSTRRVTGMPSVAAATTAAINVSGLIWKAEPRGALVAGGAVA
ncbi:hypothetical protein B484DRAFT_473051 [Ochromonadaceae sp. CCMP2298]|nr:hypothetical protein B484DRAFT_473051 [Ochromonadaceae sp. CCMP2298]